MRWPAMLMTCCFVALLLSAARADEAPDLAALVGKTVDLELQGGKSVTSGEVTKVVPGAAAGSIKSLTVKAGKPARAQVVSAAQLVEIYEDGQPLDIAYDKAARTIAHSPERRTARLAHEAEVRERLTMQRQRLWEDLTSAQQEEWIAKHKEFVEGVNTKLTLTHLVLIETKYYLFYTDMAPQTVGIYIAYLDAMYEELCRAFGIPPGKNIWCGKCVVVATESKEAFDEFETLAYGQSKDGVQGLCHSARDGNVVITVWKGKQQIFFANVLVHETAHGFLHRWKSTVHIPSWINEGVADWVAATVVKDKAVPRRQKDAVERVRQTGSLGGNFFDESQNIEPWQYGVASSLVEMLLRQDATKDRALLTGIKEGLSSDESLKAAYNLTPEELIRAYGTLAGVPNLRP